MLLLAGVVIRIVVPVAIAADAAVFGFAIVIAAIGVIIVVVVSALRFLPGAFMQNTRTPKTLVLT